LAVWVLAPWMPDCTVVEEARYATYSCPEGGLLQYWQYCSRELQFWQYILLCELQY